jgi:hypothetical protein
MGELLMEENKKTLAELKMDASNILTDYNRAINNPKDGDNIGAIQAKLQEAIKAYNDASKEITFTALKVMGTPMLAAVKKLNYDTIKTRVEKNNLTAAVTYVLSDDEQQIKLTEFDRFCDSKASANPRWLSLLTEFCLKATYKTCLEMDEKMAIVKARLEGTYIIAHTAKEILAGKTPLSKTQMTANLQKLVDAVVGENILKVTSKDLTYVDTLMNRRGGCGIVVSPRPSTMEVLLMDVLHNVLMHKSYVVQYQQKKGAPPASVFADITEDSDESNANGEATDTIFE